MKDKILKILKDSNDYISGQKICDKLSVSRTAVWKTIKALKEAGYEIDSISNKGYKLISEPDLVDEFAITNLFAPEDKKINIYYSDEIDSTNNKAKKLGEQGALHGSLVIADSQTGGRGRRGRSFLCPNGVGIWMSLLLRPNVSPDRAPMLTIVTAMSVARALKNITQCENIQIKWPNDIVMNGKKICGILTEMSSEIECVNYVVIGVGINVNTPVFPKELETSATSIFIESGTKYKRAAIVVEFLRCFEDCYNQFLKTNNLAMIMNDYNSMLISMDKEVYIIENNDKKVRVSKGIDEIGRLIVYDEQSNEERIIAGEVSVRGLYGYT